jgi:hypothetical protein
MMMCDNDVDGDDAGEDEEAISAKGRRQEER